MNDKRTIDELAQEIRRVDGENRLGAGALAEALQPFLTELQHRREAEAGENGELDAGINYAIERLCEILDVDPKSISWDAATETMDGDVSSVICNVLRAAYGDEWSSKAEDTARIRAMLAASPSSPASATHRHVKRGSEYVLIGIGKMQANLWFDGLDEDMETTVDMREVAIYRSVDDGSLWVRPREEFEDGRFVVLSALGEHP